MIGPESNKEFIIPAEGKTAAADKRLYDLSKLKQISRGNKAFEQRMILLFLDQNPRLMEEMVQAFAQEEFTTVKAIAHKLKPSMIIWGWQRSFSCAVILRNFR